MNPGSTFEFFPKRYKPSIALFNWSKLTWSVALERSKTASQYAFLFDGIENAKAITDGEKPVTELGVKAEGDHKLVVKTQTHLLKLAWHIVHGQLT